MKTADNRLRKPTANFRGHRAFPGRGLELIKRQLHAAALFVAVFIAPTAAPAASLFLHVPGITGEQSTPGFPGAMAVQSLDVMPDQFAILKSVDSASPTIINAVASGTHFSSASALLYNSAPTGLPDATLTFQNVLAGSYQLQGGGTLEHDTFVATNPGSMFLELPGIVGESSTPGHSGVMQIDSLSLTANQFSVVKAVDSASPDIIAAVTNGTPFATASVLFYNTAMPAGAPDGMFTFRNVVASGHQILNGGDVPQERDIFNFTSVVPEPATSALLMCGGLLYLTGRWKSRRK
jgi:type VI protein secretion system component Hcp